MSKKFCGTHTRHKWSRMGHCVRCGEFRIGTPERLLDDFWRKVEKTESCWVWRGAVAQNGRGTYIKNIAHRFAWLACGNPNPGKLHLHHKCGNPLCVNPAHLVPMRQADHMSQHMKRPFCKNGHPQTEENSYYYMGYGKVKRRCSLCCGSKPNGERFRKAQLNSSDKGGNRED